MLMPEMSLKGRTVREFQYSGDVWAKMDEWAQTTKYRLASQDENSRLYRKGSAGSSLLLPNRMLWVGWMGDRYRMEGWVYMNAFAQVMNFGMFPREMVLDSGPFRASVPRSRGRNEVNQLLLALGVPAIG
jgi:hypothetical protein